MNPGDLLHSSKTPEGHKTEKSDKMMLMDLFEEHGPILASHILKSDILFLNMSDKD